MEKHSLSLIWLFPLLFLAWPIFSQNIASDGDSHKANELLKEFQTGRFEISDYNTACYFALAGKLKIAFVYLTKALDDGFSNVKTLKEDSDLQSLRSDTLWQEIIQKGEKNQQLKKKNDDLFFNQKSFWETKYFATPYRANISEEEKISGLSKLWSEMKYNFVNFDLVPGTNIDSLYFAYLPKIRKTTSTLEYYKLLAEMGANLHDGHTNVFVPDTLVNEVYARPLLRSRLIENKVLIVNAYDEALKNRGIKPGLEIVAVNGLPVKQYAAQYVIPYQSSSTPQDMNTRAYEYALLAGSLTKPIQLTLSDEKGNRKAYTVYRVTPEYRDKKLLLPPFDFRMLKGNVAYVVLNSFGTDSAAKAFSEKYVEISKASAIIFDVRNNGGGRTGVGWSILRY